MAFVGVVLIGACARTGSSTATVATLSALRATVNAQSTDLSTQATLISHVATRPAFVATPVPPGAEPTPHRPLFGWVEFEQGRCCIGGRPGDEVTAQLEFEAESMFGDITEMRFRVAPARFQEQDFREDEWQPFVSSAAVPLQVAVNWIGYHVSVQFRDSAGYLSPVVYDDISVEGIP